MKSVCFLLAFTPNPRIKKRIELLRAKYDVKLIFWEKEDAFLYGDVMPDIPTHAISVCCNTGDLIARMRATLLFSKKARKILRELKPDCIYVQNLDMLAAACQYNAFRRKKAKIVYEVADIHPLLIDTQTGFKARIMQCVLRSADKAFSRRADILVNTTRTFFDEYYCKFIPESKLVVIPNVPDVTIFNNYRHKQNQNFTVGFIGLIRFKRQMQMLIETAKGSNIDVFFAGSEADEPENKISIGKLAEQNQHVKYLGKYNYETDIKGLYESADVIYSVYDTAQRDICIALPNKLYEAVYCELPILVAKGTYLAELVEEWGVGIAVSPSDPCELAAALTKLSTDQTFYASIADNCKKRKKEIDLRTYNNELLSRMNDCFAQHCNT